MTLTYSACFFISRLLFKQRKKIREPTTQKKSAKTNSSNNSLFFSAQGGAAAASIRTGSTSSPATTSAETSTAGPRRPRHGWSTFREAAAAGSNGRAQSPTKLTARFEIVQRRSRPLPVHFCSPFPSIIRSPFFGGGVLSKRIFRLFHPGS